jgi:hypothetical protein
MWDWQLPVLEVLRDGENGFAVDFFAIHQLAERVVLPRWHQLFSDLIAGRRPSI